MMVSRIVTGNVTRSLVEDIGGAIVRGDFTIGNSLPTEAELAEKYRVSRTVTREALKMLTAKGLVQAWPRRGTIVRQESDWNLFECIGRINTLLAISKQTLISAFCLFLSFSSYSGGESG